MKIRLLLLLVFAINSVFAAEQSALKKIGEYTVAEADVVFAKARDAELQARTYRPSAAGVLPAIIDVHGGAWSSGDRKQGALYDRALASAGLFVLAIDFRQAPQFKHPAANQDIAAAVRYLRTHAGELNIDPDSIGLVGSSSGGHLAMLAALTPDNEEFAGTSITRGTAFAAASDVSASVRYAIALWPVSDPAYRYEYARKVGRAELLKSHDAFFGSTAAMTQASVPRLLRAKEATHLPPFLVVQPGNDANIPREMTFDLVSAYQEAGGRLSYLFYPNQPHAFGHRASPDSTHLAQAMRDFILQTLSGAAPK